MEAPTQKETKEEKTLGIMRHTREEGTYEICDCDAHRAKSIFLRVHKHNGEHIQQNSEIIGNAFAQKQKEKESVAGGGALKAPTENQK